MTAQKLYFIRAVSAGIADEMAADADILVLGEDVTRGVIGGTRGLVATFGEERVVNTPISEATVLGACVGMAARGLRPVLDLMTGAFMYLAMDQLANQAARLRFMSGGQQTLPMVVMATSGVSGSAAAHHSEPMHPLLMGLSGIKVVLPASVPDAYGLMRSAIRDDNPVAFLIDPRLAGRREVVSEPLAPVELGRGRLVRSGDDVTVVALGSLLPIAEEVAGDLAKSGISVEIIDPRTLVPFDRDMVSRSVCKTGRLVVCDPARPVCGAASEIITSVVEDCFQSLKSQPIRVTWDQSPVPYAPNLELAMTVSSSDIRSGIMTSLEY